MFDLHEQIAALIIKSIKGELTSEEKTLLQSWLDESADNRQLFEKLSRQEELQKEFEEYYLGKKAVWEKIQAKIVKEKAGSFPRRFFWSMIAAAAVVSCVLVAGLYFLYGNNSSKNKEHTQIVPVRKPLMNDIAPGTDKAVLTLSNGSVVLLDSAGTGVLATEKGAIVNKLGDGKLVYQSTQNGKPMKKTGLDNLPYNTITTPRGGQYQVVLGDGTKVWLNAASSISYPVAFTGAERKVAITGEVYFEVAPSTYNTPGGSQKIPFTVKVFTSTGKEAGEVEVLGTHFNINAFDDETVVRTTLLEGSVKVLSANTRETMVIRPGQQAVITATQKVRTIPGIDTETVMAWKNGLFQFRSANIETIMRQAARWYDLEVVYENEKTTDRFSGKISRNVNLSQLLKILEYSNVHFRLEEGRRLVITRE